MATPCSHSNTTIRVPLETTLELIAQKMNVLTCLPCPVSVANNSDEGKETKNSSQGNEDCPYQVISCRVKSPDEKQKLIR